MSTHKILNLGAGVQSSAIYSLMVDGEIEPADYAIFSDTQDEPVWVYEQLEWLNSLDGPPIVKVTGGRIGDDLIRGKWTKTKGTRFASIPAWTTYVEGQKGGLTRRQCTREYKITPVEQWIRRELLKLAPKKHIPKNVRIVNQFGFSVDEPQRAVKMQATYKQRGVQWHCEFPLFRDELMMTRRQCRDYIEQASGFEWRSSRCVFCPLQSNSLWRELKEEDPKGYQRAIDIDEAMRTDEAACTQGLHETMYVHKTCRPLGEANLGEDQAELFEDDGGCDQGCFL